MKKEKKKKKKKNKKRLDLLLGIVLPLFSFFACCPLPLPPPPLSEMITFPYITPSGVSSIRSLPHLFTSFYSFPPPQVVTQGSRDQTKTDQPRQSSVGNTA
eukprot:TRINITY_DN2188_c2_g1_i1.p1 TRINITY_DN2188_c2_g1~~TRINITY_DN2188_c2_g1_i1.p1  ORF type:complete len:101 (+),score=0.94 TRINITY_DN2188_c2_g1_i1:722-1024(+)